MRAVADAGQTVFGESRVQEARAKIPLLPGRLRWHFIGHLQKNKIRQALPLFELFHSVDSLELARAVPAHRGGGRAAPAGAAGNQRRGRIHASSASRPTRIGAQLEDLLALDRLDITGLMAHGPLRPGAGAFPPVFRASCASCATSWRPKPGVGLPHLSMGMSGDYLVAIEEGATLVRVGSAIFGTRSGKQWTPAGTIGRGADEI